MTEQLTKRTIECVDQGVVTKSQNDDMCPSKKQKWDSDERSIGSISEQTPKQQHDEDRNNSNGLMKVKVTVSEFTEHQKVPVPDPIPYRIVVNENYKNRNFDDEAQKASNILKNIVMEKMNDKMAGEPSTSAFQGVQQHNYQPMVPLTCRVPYSRPALPVHYLPAQSNFYPPFVRQNFGAFGNLTSLPQVGIPRMVQQSGRIMVQSIPPAPSVKFTTLPSSSGTVPTATVIQPSTGMVTQSTGTMTSINAHVLPSNEYFSKMTSPAIKTTTVQVMPGTSMTYRTPGASFKNRNGKVKRPMNAFMVWARNYRSRLSEQMPQASNAQISVRLGQIWGSMSLAEKEKFFREAERIKLQHNRDFPGWVYQPKQKKVPTETQHDRLWARFGSKEQPNEVTNNSCQPTVHQIVTPTPVTVYPKTPIVTTPNVSMMSPLPSFSQLTHTVSDPTPIVTLETGKQHVPGSLVTMDGMTSGPVSESTDGSQGSVRRTTAFKIVSSTQPSAFNVQMPPKNEQQPTPHLTLSTTGHSPLKMTASCLMATGSHANGHVRSPAMAVTACPSPKGRPPSISRRVPSTPAMLISAQRAYQEAILTKSHSNSSSNTRATTMSSGPIFTTRTSDQRQKPEATPLTTASDVRSKGPQRSSKCADPVDELWPFPLPTVEQSHHVDVLYDDHLRYERESGPGYIDPYNPFYYDGSYDETRSGLQVDVNSWQKYLNYTKMQNEAEDKTNLTTCFPQTSSTSVWCDQVSNNADQIAQPATHQKQSGSVSSREPRRTSSESCFASSFTSAINVLDDDITGSALTTPDGYADVNIRAYQQNKIPQASRDVVDLQRQGSALQALDLSSGTHTQTRVSDIVYLGQETTHIGSGDGVKSIEGSPPDKSEDSRPLKKRTERYRQDFLNGKPCVTSVDVPTGTYLEDVVYLTSPEKAAAESALSRISPRQASDCINTGPKGGHTTSPKMVIDVGHDFLKSLKSGTVITDLTPANLTNAIHVGPNSVGEPAANQTHYDSTETTGNTDKSVDAAHCIAPCIVNIKQELADDY